MKNKTVIFLFKYASFLLTGLLQGETSAEEGPPLSTTNLLIVNQQLELPLINIHLQSLFKRLRDTQ